MTAISGNFYPRGSHLNIFVALYFINCFYTVQMLNKQTKEKKYEYFLSAFNDSVTSKAPALTAREPRSVVCATWQHKPHVAILTAERSNFAVFCSGRPSTYWLLLILPTPEGWNPESRLSAPGIEPQTSCTHEWTCVGAANDLTNWASQTDKMLWPKNKVHSYWQKLFQA